MRSSTILTLACAGLAAASPLMKKAYVTDIVTSTIIVYVTEGDEPTPTPAAPPAAAVPTTSSTPIEIPTPTPEPIVVSTTAEPVAPTPEPTSEAPVVTASSNEQASASEPVITSTDAKGKPGSTNAGSAANGCNLTPPTDYASTAVYWHNIHRCNNSAPALAWSDSLAQSAQILAARCVFAHDTSINGGGYGQNIASYGTTVNPSSINPSSEVASAASNLWYNGEIDLFDSSFYGLSNPSFANFEGWGHYSQVVWKSTTEVGCASQYCSAGGLFSSMGGWFTVCNYNPPGNMGGQYGANVLPPLGHAAVRAP